MKTDPAWWQAPTSLPYRLTLFLGPALCAAVAVWKLPFGLPMPDYWRDALEWAQTGVIRQRFTPSGYPLTIAVGMRLVPSQPAVGLVLEQALLHVCLALVLWGVMRRLGAGPTAALAATLLLQADPELLTSVMKVWDVAFSTLLLLLIVWSALGLAGRGASLAGCALTGAAWAFGCFDRPNYVALLPVLLLAVWYGSAGHSAARFPMVPWVGAKAGTVMVAAACTYGLCGLIAWHTLATPGNGPYNLFAGNNPYTRRALLEHLNAEPSILPALRADYVDLGTRTPDALSLQPLYRNLAMRFARTHPAGEMVLVGIKLFTLLRPDTKLHPLASASGLGKGMLAVFVPLWLATLLLFRGRGGAWRESDVLVMLAAGLYVVPFILTNADPRFRTPLDLLLATHVVGLCWRAGSGRVAAR